MRRTLLIFFVLLFGLAVYAQTADELYNRAVNKYFLGQNDEAISLLDQALEVDPSNVQARSLRNEIYGEMRKAAPPAAPSTTLSPAPVEEAPVSVPAVERPVTRIAPPRVRPTAPVRVVKKPAVGRVATTAAHEFFVQGEKSYTAGDYLKAKYYFASVLEIYPGHQESLKYLGKIELLTAAPATPEAKVTAEAAEPAAPVATVPPAPGVFDWLNTILLLVFLPFIAIMSLIIVARMVYHWWRASHVYCNECGKRNSLSSEFCSKCGNRLKFTELTSLEKSWFQQFGWVKNPFSLNIIPDTFAGHQQDISIIMEKLNKLSGHILIIGGMGTGKSTLLQWLEKNLKLGFETIYVMRPASRPEELIDLVAATLTKRTTHTHKYSVYEFQELCKKYRKNILLLLDEAHEFNESFEQFLRTLGDLPNVYLVMAGLPQAREKLKRDLPALFDRIVESIFLQALSFDETKELIQKRIANAKGSGLGPFSVPAIKKIYDLSYGIPRGILKICDWVVSKAVASKKPVIEVADIEAYREEIKSARLAPEPEKPAVEAPKNE